MLLDKIGLGTVQFGMPYGISNLDGQTSKNEVTKILRLLKLYNIRVLDSASAYGNSEEILGQHDLSSFQVISKFMPSTIINDISVQFHYTLENLNLKSLYGYLAHRPMELLNNNEDWKMLNKLKNEHKVKKIGFSLNTPVELNRLLKAGYKPDLIQVPYNYFDRRFEKFLIELRENGCEIHTRSTFLQGLFFMKSNHLNDHFNEIKQDLDLLQQNMNLNGSLLKFVIEKPFIDKVIIGVENSSQFHSNVDNLLDTPVLPCLEKQISDKILMPSKWPKEI